jgi:hypothetical protein
MAESGVQLAERWAEGNSAPIDKTRRRVDSFRKRERDERAKTLAELLVRQAAVGVAVQAWIVDRINSFGGFQEPGDFNGIRARPLDSHGERGQSAQSEPAIERRARQTVGRKHARQALPDFPSPAE